MYTCKAIGCEIAFASPVPEDYCSMCREDDDLLLDVSPALQSPSVASVEPLMKHSHYFKNVAHLHTVDVYRTLALYEVTDPCIQHATKKLLCAGGRGVKNLDKDIQESIDTLLRWQQMRIEDAAQ